MKYAHIWYSCLTQKCLLTTWGTKYTLFMIIFIYVRPLLIFPPFFPFIGVIKEFDALTQYYNITHVYSYLQNV